MTAEGRVLGLPCDERGSPQDRQARKIGQRSYLLWIRQIRADDVPKLIA
ncbi:hypothetical protein [uncultured Jannaschia sp.]|nr:hypothetical protein [uncultured Jannaschia sp.]